jgi:translation initiation factor IF-1
MAGAKGKKRGVKAAPAARQLSTKNDGDEYQYYGRVVKNWGHGMVSVRYYGAGNKSNPEEKMREIRAKVPIRRRQNKLKVLVDGLVIISIRSFGAETTGDVIHTYREGEEATLRRMRELPIELIGASGESDGEDDPFAIEFGEEDEFTDREESDGGE